MGEEVGLRPEAHGGGDEWVGAEPTFDAEPTLVFVRAAARGKNRPAVVVPYSGHLDPESTTGYHSMLLSDHLVTFL